MRRGYPTTKVRLGIAVAVAAAIAAHAQTADRDYFFVDAVDVDIVEVDVHVSDSEGRPVKGLTVDAFEVLEDGRPIEITNFREVVRGPVSETAERGRAPSPPPELPTLSEADAARREPLHLVLYVDNVNIKKTHRTRVLANLRQFVLELRARARVMVMSYDRSLEVRQAFTEDFGRVLEALVALEEEPTLGDTAEDVFRDLLREIEDRYARQPWLENRVRGLADETKHALERSLEALRVLVEDLSGLPGRKALVYVSDGLPLTPGEELFHALEKRFQNLTVLHNTMYYNASREFQRLAQVANTAGVVFYSVHAAGLEAPLASDAEIAGSGYDELRATVDSVRLANYQGSGRLLARETGGLAFLNQNDFSKGLARVANDLSRYYSLGYRARHSGDGRYHRIEVKVRGEGLDVRHRLGYRAETLTTRMRDSVRSAVSFGYGRNPLELEIAVDQPLSSGERDKTLVVPVRVGIPMRNIVLLESAERRWGRLRLYVTVQDADGGTSPVQEVEIPIEIPAAKLERALEQSWIQEVKLRMRPGPHLLVIGVWDELGRVSSIASHSFSVGKGR